MDDLISRKAAIAELDHAAWGKEYDKTLAKAMLESLPSAQPKKGKWIETDDGWDGVYYKCSYCKEAFTLIDGTPMDNFYNYCPNCGADMRGERDG